MSVHLVFDLNEMQQKRAPLPPGPGASAGDGEMGQSIPAHVL